MSTEVNEVLRHLHTLFRNCLNFQSISPHLRSHYLLTDNEWEIISKKESREDQVDEFLKCLPHKGKGCLKRLVECLQLSLNHSGHQDLINELNKQPAIADVSQSKSDRTISQDEFERAVSTISIMYSTQKDTMAALMEELNKQEAKIKELELTCDHQATTIQELSDTISTQKVDIVNLNAKLQEKEKLLLNTWPNNIMNGHSYDTEHYLHFEDHSMSMSSSSSQDSVLSNDNFKCGPPPIVVTDSNEHSDAVRDSKLSPNTHSKLVRNSSIEDRMKIYQKNMASYREKCHQLEGEKARLKEAKQQLELEVVQLREELDTVSLTSSINSITFHGHLDSGLAAAQNMKTITMPDNMYLNALYQGWLTKEGGHKKSRKRRWCMLSSRFFFYFENKKVELKSQKPIGILPLTKNMEVTDSKRDNIFEVHEKLRGTLKSCKLDKNRGVYIPGNHAVYNLQASCDDDKKGWIKAFEAVLEGLKLCN